MKVMLVNPPTGFPEMPPYGLLCLGSSLEKEGHKVYICDANLGDNMNLMLTALKPDVVGITCLTCAVNKAYGMSMEAMRRGFYTVLGGPHPSSLPEEAQQYANAVVIGEAEKSLAELVKEHRFGIVQGEPVANLDELPPPNFDLVDADFYFNIRKKIENSILSYVSIGDRVGTLMTSRGCPYRCRYCYNSTRKSPLRFLSPEKVLDSIETLVNHYRVKSICFTDDDMMSNKPRLQKICDGIIERKLKFYWSSNTRVTDITKDTLEMTYPAGGVQCAFGLESGNNRVLAELGKHATVEQADQAIELCHKQGVIVQGNFMMGNPTETEEDMQDTVRFVRGHTIDGGIGLATTTPLPGSELWDWCIKTGRMPPQLNWDSFNYGQTSIYMGAMADQNKFREFVTQAGKEFETYIRRYEPMRIEKVIKWKKEYGMD